MFLVAIKLDRYFQATKNSLIGSSQLILQKNDEHL